MKEVKISPSIMCCKVEEFKPYLDLFAKVKLDSIHFDVMDGHFVDNVMLGVTTYNDVKRLSDLPVDMHFMCTNSEKFIDMYHIMEGDKISFHPETTYQPYKLLQSIHEHGCSAGLVLNPGTPLGYLEECIDLIDYVTLMTVNPGFAGQKMVPSALEKIERTRKLLDENGKENADIVVDGNTTMVNAKAMRQAGANVFVVGTSSIITGLDTFEENYRKYKTELEVVDL